MADTYTFLDANGRNIGPIGKITSSVVHHKHRPPTIVAPCEQCKNPDKKGLHTCGKDSKTQMKMGTKRTGIVKQKKLIPLEKWNEKVSAKRLAAIPL